MMSFKDSLSNLPRSQALVLVLTEIARRNKIKNQRIAQQVESRQPDAPESVSNHGSLLFIPDHPYYPLLHSAPGQYRFKALRGGRGSAKSWSVAEALIRTAAKRSVRVLCCREHQNTIKDSSHKLLKDTIYRLGLQGFFHITKEGIWSRTGSEFIFKGLWNNEEDIKGTEGIDICWVEEGQTVSETSWITLIPTIRNPYSEIWVTWNQLKGNDPVNKRFADVVREDCYFQHINYDKNPYFRLSPLYGDMLFDKENNYHLYEHVWLGLPRRIDNSIVLNRKYREEEFPDDLWKQAERLHFGADFGYANDPSTLIRNFILNDKLYVEYEAYQTGVENDEYDEFYSRVPGSHDWPIKADGAMPGLISHIRGKWGYNISAAEKWPGSVEDGVKYLRGFKEIIVHPRCVNTLMECQMYCYKEDKVTKEVLPVFIDKYNHAIDGIRYSHDGYILRPSELGIWSRIGRKEAGLEG